MIGPDVSFMRRLQQGTVPYLTVFILADSLMVPSLESFTIEHLQTYNIAYPMFPLSSTFSSMVSLISRDYPIRKLRDYVVATIADNVGCLLADHAYSGEIQKALEENFDLHMAVTVALTRRTMASVAGDELET